MTAPTETAIKERLASIASTATGITVLSYTLFTDMPQFDPATLGLLQGERLHYGFVSKVNRRHFERTAGPHGTTVRLGVYRVSFYRGYEFGSAGESAISTNIEALSDYLERYDTRADEIFPSSTYPGVRIMAGEGSGREDGEEITRAPDSQYYNHGWYQVTIHQQIRRGA